MPFRTLYDILGVKPNASFDELKKAYYARAKQCHPDLNDDNPAATEEFQKLVNAFDILSDPKTRKRYDQQRALSAEHLPNDNHFHDAAGRIMDTIADDILEELVVGNNISLSAMTLQTLMLDLTKTSHFIMFREARHAFDAGHVRICHKLCEKLVSLSPQNILYHYYLAEAAKKLHKDTQALRHYRRCLHIGSLRIPPQRLDRIRRHYQSLLKKQGWFGKCLAWLAGEPPAADLSEKDITQRGMDAYFSKAFAKDKSRLGSTNNPTSLPKQRKKLGNSQN